MPALPIALLLTALCGAESVAAESVEAAAPAPTARARTGLEHELRAHFAFPTALLGSAGISYTVSPLAHLRLSLDLSAGQYGEQGTVGARLAFRRGAHTFTAGAEGGLWYRDFHLALNGEYPSGFPRWAGIVRLEALGWDGWLGKVVALHADVGAVVNLRGSERYSPTGSSGNCVFGTCPVTVRFWAVTPEIRFGVAFALPR